MSDEIVARQTGVHLGRHGEALEHDLGRLASLDRGQQVGISQLTDGAALFGKDDKFRWHEQSVPEGGHWHVRDDPAAERRVGVQREG